MSNKTNGLEASTQGNSSVSVGDESKAKFAKKTVRDLVPDKEK